MKHGGLFRQSLVLFSKRAKAKLFMITIFQLPISVLDLLGVVVIGLIGLSVIPTSESNLGMFTQQFYKILQLTSFSGERHIVTLCLLATFLLVLRAVISVEIINRILYFLGFKSASLSEEMSKKILSRSITCVGEMSSQASRFAITRGIDYLTMKVIETGLILASYALILIVLTIGLFFVSAFSAIGICILFGFTRYFIHKIMGKRAEILRGEITRYTVLSNEMITDTIQSYRESFVHSQTPFLANRMGGVRLKLPFVSAKLDFQPYVSKYIVESALIFGMLSVALFQFESTDTLTTATTLILFIAPSVRIVRSALRVQQDLTLIRSCSGMVRGSIEFMNKLRELPDIVIKANLPSCNYSNFNFKIRLRALSYRYRSWALSGLENVDLDIHSGKITAVIGPSGSGRTTLIDSLLGILEPSSGFVKPPGRSPKETIVNWPEVVSYVPQQVNIINSTKGENESKLSGGQKQKLGIARALLTRPGILVLNKATSSLNNKTGGKINRALNKLKEETTIITAAHRIDTSRNADQIICMNGEQIITTGSYESISQNFSTYIRASVDYDS